MEERLLSIEILAYAEQSPVEVVKQSSSTHVNKIDAQLKAGITLAKAKESEEAEEVWTIIDGKPTLLEDFEGLEHTFIAETSNMVITQIAGVQASWPATE